MVSDRFLDNVDRKKANIFVASAAMQVFTSKAIIEDYFSCNLYSNFMIVMAPQLYEIEVKADFCTIIFLKPQKGLNKLRELYHLKKILNLIRYNFSFVDIFIAHPYQWLANYLLFQYDHNGAYLMQEGILSYYSYNVNDFQKKNMKRNAALNWVFGFPYKPYDGLLTMADKANLYQGLFTFSLEGLFCAPKKIFKISVPNIQYHNRRKCKKRYLFLDQYLEDFVDREDVKKVCNLVFEYLYEHGKTSEIYYKLHPAQRKKSNVISKLKQRGVKVFEINTPKPIELFIGELGVDEVVGYFSSALVMLKYCIPNLRCTSIGFDIISKYRNLGPIKQYFVKHDVIFH